MSIFAVLIATLLCFPQAQAHAESVDDAQNALDEAETRMASIVNDYNTLQSEIDELQERINATAKSALEAQSAMLAGRDDLGKTARYEYKGGSSSLFLSVLFGSSSLDELLHNFTYLNSIEQYQADEVQAQKQRTKTFEDLLSKLNVQKETQDEKLSELASKREEAAQVVSSAKERLSDAQTQAEAERLAALEAEQARLAAQAQAEAEAQAQAEEQAKAEEAAAQDSNSSSNNSSSNSGENSNSNNTSDNTPDNSSGWSSGIASAYGGSTDSSVSNPCRTATGDICDDNSMGVAIPMSWKNYRSYFGRTVEISYGGKTVLATVNDCGGMGSGSRVLDLQPGVFKAFGFSSCDAWGLRTVSYRFL